jgi:hypothetical protein
MFPNIVPFVGYLAYGNRERLDGGLKKKYDRRNKRRERRRMGRNKVLEKG